MGLGAVLAQLQSDYFIHPIAYACHGLPPAKCNYGITDLKTLAVVLVLYNFHYYPYGHKVTVITDCTVDKAILDAPNPS